MKNLLVPLDQLSRFDEIVDVRTPLEFAEDHIPGALNAPVLSNEERVIVGTMYAQVSPFEATRVGAAMVARNIAQHLETTFADRPRNWRPLIYCWRGGKRSGSMTTWFNLIGWQARQLDGGYKVYRRSVLDTLASLPGQFDYVALIGHTGSGKTRLLQALRQAGAQVLDLEALARHRGSLLGALPDQAQPAQKAFDTALVEVLSGFDARRPVFVESESRRIGSITLPDALLERFHQGLCVEVDTAHDERVAFLLQDYAHLFDHPERFKHQLQRLIGLHSREQVKHWHALIDAASRDGAGGDDSGGDDSGGGDAGARSELFAQLIDRHYDPAYQRSSRQHFSRLADALHFEFRPTAADSVGQAEALLAQLASLDPRTLVRDTDLTKGASDRAAIPTIER
ncbi:tRNA 2-selenouridine(34) synthase MnmH [Paraburkholderia sp. DHOC27]|uniref:tRNA 2-selenouridine(34) synthase MnmH n=1 Tax=Paraburkholderia sp. DHOC27 TaxID=2303330 RepID=UPI000E3C0B05|nr:tRNA 2-selenouridine(34) synthase MnmH [Paraburkholderia sp. DHOC27]RFU47863.1 tRNA 2-selenouridine(34) synthase MnmH [Paraburkholderia sp. DHOC27]